MIQQNLETGEYYDDGMSWEEEPYGPAGVRGGYSEKHPGDRPPENPMMYGPRTRTMGEVASFPGPLNLPKPKKERDAGRGAVRTGFKPSDYVYGSTSENIEKSALLREYAQIDPSMGKKIAEYTNQLSGGYLPHMGPGKDLYALGQDAYLMEMGRMGYLKGVRGAHKATRR